MLTVGSAVKVKKLVQVQTREGLEIQEQLRSGVIQAIELSDNLYKKAPQYSKDYKGKRNPTKYPAGTKIYQVQLEGESCARNFEEKCLVQ